MLHQDLHAKLQQCIRTVKDFPKVGIEYKDITPLLANPVVFHELCDFFQQYYQDKRLTAIASIESRGFIFGSVLAYALKLPFVPVRKMGKLPFTTHTVLYDLEYGSDSLEVHTDAFNQDSAQHVLLIDDVLATGGTAAAAIDLLLRAGVQRVSACFLLELKALLGRHKLESAEEILSLIEEV